MFETVRSSIERTSLLFFLLVLLAPVQACKTITDDGITADVKRAIAPVVKEGSLRIEVTTSSGVVTLRGGIQSERQRLRMTDLVKQVDGVKSIIDELTIMPLPAEKPGHD